MPETFSPQHLYALALPKAEQHIHDVGSMPVSMLLQLAKQHQVDDLPDSLRAGSYDFGSTGLTGFVAMYVSACAVLQTPADYRQLGRTISINQAAQNVKYCRVHHTPAIPGARDGTWTEPLEALLAGFCDGLEAGGAFCHVLIDIPAEFDQIYPDNDFRQRTLQTALEHKAVDKDVPGVVALGVAGDHQKLHWSQYAEMLLDGRQAGLEIVVHAGESTGPETIDSLMHDVAMPDRISHGIAAALDRSAATALTDRSIPLDMAIGSNLLLGNLDQLGLAGHPFLELHRQGARVSLNTDDPTMFRTDMVNELARAQLMDASTAEVGEMSLVAWDDAFAPDHLRAAAEAEIAAMSSADPLEVIEDFLSRHPGATDAYRQFVAENHTDLVAGEPSI